MQQGHASLLLLAGLMFLAGVGIPIMGTLNSGLGRELGSPIAATAWLLGGGCLILLLALVVTGGPPALDSFKAAPKLLYAAALFVAFYNICIAFAGPRIGIGNAIFLSLMGQLVAAALIDHYGLWGAIRTEITPKRVLGLGVMALGVYLARKPV